MNNKQPVYTCVERPVDHFPTFTDKVWNNLDKMELRDTETGRKPRLSTEVTSFWSKECECLFFRFVCEDDHIVSTMADHDDPIYEEDVVEVFISETGSLNIYKEFEVSPANVKFDAIIHNDPPDPIRILKEWHAAGWKTEVRVEQDQSQYISIWEVPFANFEGGCPSKGDQWRMNCYRIDRGLQLQDQYMAWSPTGNLNFHTPASFGLLRFE